MAKPDSKDRDIEIRPWLKSRVAQGLLFTGAAWGAVVGGREVWRDMFPPKDPEANVRTTEPITGTSREAEVVEDPHAKKATKQDSARGR